jgi:hypothetical protein
MRLEDARSLDTPVPCFICQYGGRLLEVWPIEPGNYIWLPVRSTPSGREWRIRVKNLGDPDWHSRWTGKRAANICTGHAVELYAEWEQLAKLEVDLNRAIDSYEQREDERKELYG